MNNDIGNGYEEKDDEKGTIVGRFYYKLSYVLYALLVVLGVTGLVIRNHYMVGIAAFSSMALVLIDLLYGKKKYGPLVMPLVREGRFLYRLRNAYRILWIKHKYLTTFIFANVCLAIYIAIDGRRLDLGVLVVLVLIFEGCVVAGIAAASDSEQRGKD